MLDQEGSENINKIRDAAKQTWGDQCRLQNPQVHEAPFCMFEIHMRIYDRFSVVILCDRSVVDISFRTNGRYEWLAELSPGTVVEGAESCRPENLLRNFRLLDAALKSL